jgi:predicted site-specific integrase-resolvase
MIRGEMMQLLTPREVDVMLRYPAGRTLRLVKAGKIPSIRLPDGEVRIDEAALKKLLDAGTYRGARRG